MVNKLHLKAIILVIALLFLIEDTYAFYENGTIIIDPIVFDGDFTLKYDMYPFVFYNEKALLIFKTEYNETIINDSNVTFILYNFTTNNILINISLPFKDFYNGYPVFLLFNNVDELGNYSWFASAERFGYFFKNLSGTISVVDYKKIFVNLYKECSWYNLLCEEYKPYYDNVFGHIFAVQIPDNRKDIARFNAQLNLQIMADFAEWGNEQFNKSALKIYKFPFDGWHSKYNDGISFLPLPANRTYALFYVSGDYQYPSYYGSAYYTSKRKSNVILGVINTSEDKTYSYSITEEELNKESNFILLLVVITVGVLGFIIGGIAISLGSAGVGLIIIFVTFILLPIIYYIGRLIIWVL